MILIKMGSNKKRKNKNKQVTNELENETQNNSDIETDPAYQENENEFDDSKGTKRLHTHDGDDDAESETEKKPKKAKKKKKEPVGTNSTEKKGKKSIRQIKKEKHAQRQAEAQSVAKDQLKSQCITYLSQWKHDRQNWKFMKAKQVWLYKNKFSPQFVPENSWPILLEYFESAKGNIRTMLLADAHKIIKEMDEWTESQENEVNIEKEGSETTAEVTKPDISVYNRARSLIQCLEE